MWAQSSKVSFAWRQFYYICNKKGVHKVPIYFGEKRRIPATKLTNKDLLFAFHCNLAEIYRILPLEESIEAVGLRLRRSHDEILENLLRKVHRPESMDYVTKVLNVEDLRHFVYAAINTITLDILNSVFRDITEWLQSGIVLEGGHVKLSVSIKKNYHQFNFTHYWQNVKCTWCISARILSFSMK